MRSNLRFFGGDSEEETPVPIPNTEPLPGDLALVNYTFLFKFKLTQ